MAGHPIKPSCKVALPKLGTLLKLPWNEENLEKNIQWERAWCPLLGSFPLASRFLFQHILAAHVQVAFNLSMYDVFVKGIEVPSQYTSKGRGKGRNRPQQGWHGRALWHGQTVPLCCPQKPWGKKRARLEAFVVWFGFGLFWWMGNVEKGCISWYLR